MVKPPNQEHHKLDLHTGINETSRASAEEINQMTKKDKSMWLLKNTGEKIKDGFFDTIKTIATPFLTKTHETTALLMASKSSLSGEDSAEIYQLINLLSNKKHYISLKAAYILEQRIINPEVRKTVNNYFKFNPSAKTKFQQLYKTLMDAEALQESENT